MILLDVQIVPSVANDNLYELASEYLVMTLVLLGWISNNGFLGFICFMYSSAQ